MFKKLLLIITINILLSFSTIGEAMEEKISPKLLFNMPTELYDVDKFSNLESYPFLIRKSNTGHESPRFITPKRSNSFKPETSVDNYYLLESPPAKIKNYFSYRGEYTIALDSNSTCLVDSLLFNTEKYFTLLDEFISDNQDQINMVINRFSKEYEKYQQERQLEAKAYLTWPALVIICVIILSLLVNRRNTAYGSRTTPMEYIVILLIIASVIMTLNSLPDYIVLFKGDNFSLFNSIR